MEIPANLAKIEIEPLFFIPNHIAHFLFGAVEFDKSGNGKQEIHQRFSLGVGGANGVCKLWNRTDHVKPQVERKPKAAAAKKTLPDTIEVPDVLK